MLVKITFSIIQTENFGAHYSYFREILFHFPNNFYGNIWRKYCDGTDFTNLYRLLSIK